MLPMFDGDSHPEEIEAAISRQLGAIDPAVTPFRLRNRYRQGVGTWIVSVAVPTGHPCDEDALVSAADALGMRVEGFVEYSGDLNDALADDLGEPPTKDGLPLTNEDQFCAFCDDPAPLWVHPFDPDLTVANLDADLTLPTFWTVCQTCEALVVDGRDEDLARRVVDHDIDDAERAAKSVARFRAADLGGRPITHVPEPS